MRDPGFYWVRLQDSKEWIVAQWWIAAGTDNGFARWSFPGSVVGGEDAVCSKIDERRIMRGTFIEQLGEVKSGNTYLLRERQPIPEQSIEIGRASCRERV